MTQNTKIYIGDGVYAKFDGFGVWLIFVEGPEDLQKIYLAPNVMKGLQDFWASMQGGR